MNSTTEIKTALKEYLNASLPCPNGFAKELVVRDLIDGLDEKFWTEIDRLNSFDVQFKIIPELRETNTAHGVTFTLSVDVV